MYIATQYTEEMVKNPKTNTGLRVLVPFNEVEYQ
jgi:hypothetical protein